MGLSSSQARLLNLTNRMHQIEYNAARIEAMKLQMANESRRVYEDYLEALDQCKIQKKTLTTNGAVTFVDMKSYDEFINAGFALVVHGVPNNSPNPTKTAIDDGYTSYVEQCEEAGTTPQDEETWKNAQAVSAGYETYNDIPATLSSHDGDVICTTETQLSDNVALVLGTPVLAGLRNTKTFEETLTNLINSGIVTIIQKPADPSKYQGEINSETGFPELGTNAFAELETSVAINTSLQEVTDDVKLRKAEAKYEADMKRIDMKDRRYDSDLAALDNERNAIKQEMETLKTVARDNVERTFKIFS